MHLRDLRLKPWATAYLVAFFVVTLAVSAVAQAPTPPPPSPPQPPAKAPNPPVPILQNATGPKDTPLFPKDMVILTIGEHKYTVTDFDRIMEIFTPQQRMFFSGAGKRNFADQFTQLIIYSEEARRQKLDNDPVVKQRLDIVADQTLAQALTQKINENLKITDEDVQKYYNEHSANYDEIKASHILIRTKGSAGPLPQGKKELTEEEAKAKAEEVYKQVIAPGADFAAIAKEESYDQGSATQGGELGWFPRGRMVPAFDTAAFAMNVGEISQPVKSPFGYHIIKILEKKKRNWQEAKSEIANALRPEKINEAMEALRKATKVEVNDQFFPPPPPPTPMPAPAPVKPPTTPPAVDKKN